MYTKNQIRKTTIRRNTSYKGETIEQKVRRVVNNKEPIKDGAPLVYTDRKDGVRPEYDIRTDRWEIAVDAMDKVTGDKLAKREERHKPVEEAKPGENKDGGAESTQATDNK